MDEQTNYEKYFSTPADACDFLLDKLEVSCDLCPAFNPNGECIEDCGGALLRWMVSEAADE